MSEKKGRLGAVALATFSREISQGGVFLS